MKHIGLKRGAVELFPYNNAWLKLFEVEKQRLLIALNGIISEIEHIGSTAIPSLAAKPLIDIIAAIDSLSDYRNAIKPLQALDYEFMPERVFVDRVFFPKGPRENRTFHLSLVEKNSKQWVDSLLFRDYLRSHVDGREKYQLLKEKLAQHYANDRELYTKGKEEFISLTLELARK
jgi:GrpB-like predicted nucleotidyltransferase (UPF0157 family)